jgi:hypothetical protein
MRIEYEIGKGQQYDADGAHVFFGRHGFSSYRADGQRDTGDLITEDHRAEVELVVRRVIATGQDETIVCGEPTLQPASDEINLAGTCGHYTVSDGCPLHGELCAPVN